MKKWSILSGIALFTAVLSGCSSAYYASAGYAGDDLYETHDRTAIARRQQQEAEARKAEAEARRAEWEARIAEAEAAAAERQYNGTSGSNSYSYSSVLADSYESAYARRLRGFESLSYRMPSSYYNFRYGDAFTYVSAYDPAFYNIVVSGDQVWVEPKYITSMFGTWGATVYTGGWYGGWDYGWRFGSAWWRYPSWGWSWGFAYHPWHDPWYRAGWGPAWGPYWYGHAGYRPAHNYRLDRYPASGGSNWRGSTSSGSRNNGYGTGSNSGRTGSYNNGRGTGSYNNRGTGSSSRSNNSTNNRNNTMNNNSNYNNGSNSNSNSNRSGSYNNSSSGRGGFGGSTGGYSGGYSGGSSGGSSGRGGGSYNGGR